MKCHHQVENIHLFQIYMGYLEIMKKKEEEREKEGANDRERKKERER